ncbi:cell division protein FtsL [Guyparkeria hydrothermalis]|uniref:cell division protein FtsL n=1 Tax=Guyparkeria TaxID=2035712 RepID=UPI0010AC5328|nr:MULTISPECIES: cell division protein FtsL [Guyparkeria]MCL7750470.1 cell division protein FtsL [Guyparkeria hydrothermalis]TKA90583.1 cell division protein FtsL [Guyparkeria sp. SB14A]
MRAVNFLLLMLVVASALAVVMLVAEDRRLTQELAVARDGIERLEGTYAELQLEEGTLTAQGRIERIATEELGMLPPAEDQITVVFR